MNVKGLLPAAVVALCVSALYGQDAQVRPPRVQDIMEEMQLFFEGADVRYPGSPGNLAIEQKIYRRFSGSDFPHGEITFEAPSFIPGKTTLTVKEPATAAGEPPLQVKLFPMHPTIFRPGNFPEKDFTANLVYLGKGRIQDLARLAGKELDGAIAVMDFDCGDAWQRFLRFGVKGFIFIGADRYSYWDARAKVYATEVSVPRFFVQPAEGRRLKGLLNGSLEPLRARITAEPSRWRNVPVRDLWVLVPGSDPNLEKEVCVFVAPMDSNSVVPQLATGAQSGANLYLLLQLFETFKKEPPARSVLLAAVNAHTQNYLGERMLAWYLLAENEQIANVRNLLAADMRVQTMLAEKYKMLNLTAAGKGAADAGRSEELLIKMRTLMDESTGKKVLVKEPIVALARRDVNQMKAQKLTIHRSELPGEKKEKLIDELDALYKKHVNVLTLFNRVGIRTKLSELSEEELEILKGYVAEIIRRNETWARLNRQELEMDIRNGRLRNALAGRKVSLVFTLDMTWRGNAVGFSSFDSNVVEASKQWAHSFGVNSTRIAEELRNSGTEQLWEKETQILKSSAPLFVDTMTGVGGLPEQHFFPVLTNRGLPLVSGICYFHVIGNTPALSLRNVFVDSGLAFTPGDTFENLFKENGNACVRLMKYVPRLFRAILADRNITSARELPPAQVNADASGYSIQIRAFKFDEFSASARPQLPVPGSVILLFSATKLEPLCDGDVINCFFQLTDSRASRIFYCISGLPASGAFHFDEDFIAIDHAIDAGDDHERVTSNVTVSQTQTFALFACKELPIYERHDSSLVSVFPIAVKSFLPLGGRRDAILRRYGITGMNSLSGKLMPETFGPAAVFIEKGEKLKLLTDEKRLALNASPDLPQGKGYSSGNELGPDFFEASAHDMSYLNRYRLGKMSGVSNQMAQDFLHRGDEALEEEREAKAQKDHAGFLRKLYEALGCQVKAYGQISAITNDMLKAIVFYMALLLPFCFFVQKLLFKFVKIESQMGAFAVLFVITFILFRIIHPAFRIARAPEAIFIAFVMGSLGTFVIYILHSRFEGEMQLLFRTFTARDAGEVGYSMVGQKAMLIGVNNMKRRRIRTALTTATIVLVTFAMLTFSSVSKKVSPTIIPVGKKAKYTGIFYQWPGSLRMDEASMQVFLDLFSDLADAGTADESNDRRMHKRDIIVRRWLLPPRLEREALFPFEVECSTGTSGKIDAVLGLPASDDGFLGSMPLSRGRFFSSEAAQEAVVSATLSAALKIDPDELGEVKISFQGHPLTVVGIVDDERFREIRDLNNRPILPIKDIQKPGFIDAKATDLEASLKVSPTGEESGVFYVGTAALLILPVETAKRLGAEPFSVSVRFEPDEPIWPVIDKVLTVTAAKFYVGSTVPFAPAGGGERLIPAGAYYVGSGYKTSIGGFSRLIIPLLIAASIILNTMLGSVYERKQEIAVYNAIGLNPTHIGFFFLAEAFVYSVIGSVGGYLIGQALAILLIEFNLVKGINLNFSSLNVVYVIMFTIVVVLLSTLYPAACATRAAVPSGKRKWSMPDHVGNTMKVVFPFIYQPELVGGVMAYIEEYFSRFTEASFGEMISALEKKARGTDAGGRDVYTLVYEVALAPFDLGVTQKVEVRCAYEEVVQSYRVTMTITRISGQDSNWITTNKPFLEKMRKYLINWRNLDPAQHALYSQAAGNLFR